MIHLDQEDCQIELLNLNMKTSDGFSVLSHVYDAAVNLGGWRRALDAVAETVDAKAISLLIRRPEPNAKDLQMLDSTYLRFSRSPWGAYYGLRYSSLQNPDWDFLSQQPTHRPTPDIAIGCSAEELDRRGDYAFLRKKLGVGRRLGVRLNSDKVWFDAMSIAFDANVSSVPQLAIDRTCFLLPHLTKAVELGRTFAQLKSRYAAALTALDRVKVGLAIALPSGAVIIANEEARRITRLKDGLTLHPNGHLCCDHAEQSAELDQAIVRAAGTARGQDRVNEWLIALRRPSQSSPFLVDVSPLKDSTSELDGPLEGALVTIIDPERVQHVRVDRFVTLYGLTEAEADVCKLIVQGKSVNEVAEIRNTSPVTAKNQVNAVLGKTNAGSRSQLIRMIVRVIPPIE